LEDWFNEPKRAAAAVESGATSIDHAMTRLSAVLVISLLSVPALGRQDDAVVFNARVKNPAYTASHPQVLYDEAHFNLYAAGGRYKPFADLVTSDGYRVVPTKEPFTAQSLMGSEVLVIVNAGSAQPEAADRSKLAFTNDECSIVREWVGQGGALLLVADQAPAGTAAANLAVAFDVEMGKAFTIDPVNFEQSANNLSWIGYSRANKGLGDHPIMRGRDSSERINRVLSFTGQSLKGPKESVPLLILSRGAYDLIDLNHPDPTTMTSAAGRAQAVALVSGKGRVVVFGEAAMLTAQAQNFGMNYPGVDNRQLVLNVMHWLTGLLK
jgi:hypothetical protein